MKREIRSDALSRPTGVFSQAIAVPATAELLFVSGLTARGRDGAVVAPGDIRAQTDHILQSLTTLLAEAGATLDDVVRVTVYVTDMRHFDAIHEVRARFFTPPLPASTMVEVSQLALPGMVIEVEAIAALPGGDGG